MPFAEPGRGPRLARALARARQGAEFVGVGIFTALFGAFLLQVLFRYALNRPLGWTDEVSLVLYAWAIFWACAFVVPWREHVCFDLLFRAAPPPGRRVLGLAGAALIFGLTAAALPATVDFVAFMARERTPVLGWRYDYVFACFALFLAALAARAAVRIAELLGRRWRDHVASAHE
jgi:TRAP-type C4-dicarboxylate transport system permease small subunit